MTVYNVGRDESRIYMTDTDSLAPEPEPAVAEASSAASSAASTPVTGSASSATGSSQSAQNPADSGRVAAESTTRNEEGTTRSVQTTAADGGAQGATQSGAAQGVAGNEVADIPFKAHDAIATLLAYAAKIRPEQIGGQDTTDTLTNGVSSRRNQLLMDISSELGVASVDGAAEASIDALSALVDKVAPNYKAFGPVLADIVRDRMRGLFGAAGVKTAQVEARVRDVWGLGNGWASREIGRAHV